MGAARVPEQAATGALEQCGTCGRKFNPTSYEKHVRVCQKVFAEKRKPVDMARVRKADGARRGTDRDKGFGQEYSRPFDVKKKGSYGGKPQPADGPKKAMPKWKQQSMAFR